MAGRLVSTGHFDSADTANALETAYAAHTAHSAGATYPAYSFESPGRVVAEKLATVVGMMLSSGPLDTSAHAPLCSFRTSFMSTGQLGR
jgi:hypothetical protein